MAILEKKKDILKLVFSVMLDFTARAVHHATVEIQITVDQNPTP